MSTATNKALVTAFWEAFSAGRVDDAFGMLADDLSWWVSGSTKLSGTYTKKQFADLLGRVGPLAPEGLRVTPTVLTAEEDRVAMEGVSYGKITNGKTYENKYHFMHIVRGGRIAVVREYMDTEHVTAVFGDVVSA